MYLVEMGYFESDAIIFDITFVNGCKAAATGLCRVIRQLFRKSMLNEFSFVADSR